MPALARAVTTSRYSGSPLAPGSFVRSSTAILLTVAGMASMSLSARKRTVQADLNQADLFAACVHVVNDFFCHVSQTEPMATITRFRRLQRHSS